MAGMRSRIENIFATIGAWCYDKKYLSLTMCMAVMFTLTAQLKQMQVDNSVESFFRKDDPALTTYEEFRDQFGKDIFFVIAFESKHIFTSEFLGKLVKLHSRLEESVPYIDEITSLVNIRTTRGEGNDLIVEELMGIVPETPAEMDGFRREVLSNPLYINSLISEDGNLTAIIIKPDSFILDSAGSKGSSEYPEDNRRLITTKDYAVMYHKIKEAAEAYRSGDINIYYAGEPMITFFLDETSIMDMRRLTPLSLSFCILFLTLMFRRLSGVLYPIIIVAVSLFSTFGVMVLVRIPLTSVTNILPTFLVVMGVADSVHILAVFYRSHQFSGDKRAAISEALAHSGLAVLMTSITTSVGLISFVTADVGPIADLGILAPIGVMFAFLYTILLLPAGFG